MKVKELIEKLLLENQEQEVFACSENGEWTPIKYVHKCDSDEYCCDEDCVVLSEYSYVGA
ncbi:MAG: hypothetical protein ACRDDY_03500 [Clostridium sp.]|uniref:hypothetical protein n=1 Tax=Clostridium sp. TaxID=1506 RepID=UPI003EE5F860